ncbi:hypothetical protein BKM31_16920 [[Actinomadura] parvosata subsp. kistnae]|uniref:Uncharacterized protein n=1 Tax=[Actinomadura] parvosata subsp. kistnae TaxID=1909395 RepID=A0A1U9ZY92_9ACTN|nr:hypothetical protein [Nonomuraea sp. ATCC 55076]AQZ62918.1 hypothetical protein BKM31_16920 [Nonomuraea sp. ATCC 55076]
MHPDALTHRARRHGWSVETAPGPVLTLRRHCWLLEIAFTGNAPQSARITSPDDHASRPVNLRSINTLLRADPTEIARHAAEAVVGQRPHRTHHHAP